MLNWIVRGESHVIKIVSQLIPVQYNDDIWSSHRCESLNQSFRNDSKISLKNVYVFLMANKIKEINFWYKLKSSNSYIFVKLCYFKLWRFIIVWYVKGLWRFIVWYGKGLWRFIVWYVKGHWRFIVWYVKGLWRFIVWYVKGLWRFIVWYVKGLLL